MSNEVSLPDLDKLHAEATPGPWRQCGADRGGCVCGWVYSEEFVVLDGADTDSDLPCPPKEQVQANTEWIASIHNTWPTISARLKEHDEVLRQQIVRSNNMLELTERTIYADMDKIEEKLDAAEDRVKLLEETLRGVLQEKQKQRDLMQSGAIDKAGTKAGEAYEWAKGEIEREIAWLESVLGGNQ